MTALAKDVNDKKRQEEQQTGMFEAFESTKNCPPTFIKHSRKMVFKIDVYELKVVGGGSSDKSSSSVGGGGGAPSSSSPSAGMSYNATSGSGSIAIGASDRLVMGNKQYRLFLCNDVLMLTSHAKTPGVLGNIIGRGADVDKQYKYICLVPLTEVEVEDVPDHREGKKRKKRKETL